MGTSQKQPSANQENDANPFVLPPDEEVFRIRELEQKKKQEHLGMKPHLKIYEKGTMSSKIGNIRRFESIETSELNNNLLNQSRKTNGLVAAAKAAISSERLREKENMNDFIAKKREMFLVQMSLDTKREEIRKLEDTAQLKEDALKKSELMLEEDAVRFDTFLKDNDKKAHEAIKKAERETKAKAEKVQEIKKINQQIQLVQSDTAKLSEQLQDCLQYKAFLDALTPQEYEVEERLKRQKLRDEKLTERRNKLLKDWEEKRDAILAQMGDRDQNYPQTEKPQTPNDDSVSKGTSRRIGTADKNKREIHLPPMPNIDDIEISEPEDDIPMYFQHPQQLLDIFTALEESNLFLIQNSQETEQTLEELKATFRKTKSSSDQKTEALKLNIEKLQQQITAEDVKANQLRQRSQGSTSEIAQEKMLKELHDRVLEVYKRCGFDAESNSSTLYMLTDLEARLEDLLSAIEQMPEDYVTKAEKEKEKERRERVRQERISQQQKIYEERMKKSMERSLQAPKKRKGRMVMWRSQPERHIKHDEDDKVVDENDEADNKHFIW